VLCWDAAGAQGQEHLSCFMPGHHVVSQAAWQETGTTADCVRCRHTGIPQVAARSTQPSGFTCN
jgi:hypothetical protein